jgi:hypothetical protein
MLPFSIMEYYSLASQFLVVADEDVIIVSSHNA